MFVGKVATAAASIVRINFSLVHGEYTPFVCIACDRKYRHGAVLVVNRVNVVYFVLWSVFLSFPIDALWLSS